MSVLAERTADPYLTASLVTEMSSIALGPIPVLQGLELLEEVRARVSGHDPWVDEWRATLLAQVGRHDEARVLHEQVMQAWQDRRLVLAVALCKQGEWQIAMAAGEVERAAAAARCGCDELERLGEHGWMSTNAAQLAEALCMLGRDEEAGLWVERALELGDSDDALTQSQARVVRALLRARRGEGATAHAEVEEALRVTAGMQAPQVQGEIAMIAAQVFSRLGERAAAEEQLRRAVALFDAKGSAVYAARATDALGGLTGA